LGGGDNRAGPVASAKNFVQLTQQFLIEIDIGKSVFGGRPYHAGILFMSDQEANQRRDTMLVARP
jgi:hypothetical protein